jgi:protein phosphatase
MCLELAPPVRIVGDLHGHFLDLIRILQSQGLPPAVHYLFLGDIVDRGQFSTETLCLILLLKVLWPNHVHVIRGNHEFDSMCVNGGFLDEILHIYGETALFLKFINLFSVLPLAALIGSSYLCVHGGLDPAFTHISQISLIPRPLHSCDGAIVESILWSDPVDGGSGFRRSSRGLGYTFGDDVLSMFLAQNNLESLIRAHECVSDGVQDNFNQTLFTVFSASNYCGVSRNRAGILRIDPDMQIGAIRFEPLPFLRRDSKPTSHIIPHALLSLGLGSLASCTRANVCTSRVDIGRMGRIGRRSPQLAWTGRKLSAG